MLVRFRREVADTRPTAARAVGLLCDQLADGLSQSDLCLRSGLGERSVRIDIRLGAELLCDWLIGLSERTPGEAELRQGIQMIPVWMHHPSPGKRAKVLLLLALVYRRLHAAGSMTE